MIKARHWRRIAPNAVLCAVFIAAIGASRTAAADHPSFQTDILPILQERCVACHRPGGEGYAKSGLDLTTYEGLMKGTRHGSIVVPGDAFTSNLNVLIEGRAAREIRMPYHKKKLNNWQRVLFRRWVNRGAKNN